VKGSGDSEEEKCYLPYRASGQGRGGVACQGTEVTDSQGTSKREIESSSIQRRAEQNTFSLFLPNLHRPGVKKKGKHPPQRKWQYDRKGPSRGTEETYIQYHRSSRKRDVTISPREKMRPVGISLPFS